MRILLILISFLYLGSKASANYQEQILVPIVSQEETEDIRKLPPTKKQYPILDEFEKHLYPSKNFHKDSPDKRLERIEIAVFGSKQSGSIKNRLTALEMELTSWDIASVSKKSLKNPRNKIEPQASLQAPMPNFYQAPAPLPLRTNTYTSRKRQVDYDYMNYRMVSPLIQTIGRKSISTMFDSKKK